MLLGWQYIQDLRWALGRYIYNETLLHLKINTGRARTLFAQYQYHTTTSTKAAGPEHSLSMVIVGDGVSPMLLPCLLAALLVPARVGLTSTSQDTSGC